MEVASIFGEHPFIWRSLRFAVSIALVIVLSQAIKIRAQVAPGRQQVWVGLTTSPQDLTIIKNRYSALIAGSSSLERVLRNLGVDTILIAGTKTNVCCEATARDAMMLDFKVVMVSDCCAALSDDEHRASLETIIQQFGDVLTGEEVFARLDGRSNLSR